MVGIIHLYLELLFLVISFLARYHDALSLSPATGVTELSFSIKFAALVPLPPNCQQTFL
jgi:hypothetical protein